MYSKFDYYKSEVPVLRPMTHGTKPGPETTGLGRRGGAVIDERMW
jgi:hypothetical protein